MTKREAKEIVESAELMSLRVVKNRKDVIEEIRNLMDAGDL